MTGGFFAFPVLYWCLIYKIWKSEVDMRKKDRIPIIYEDNHLMVCEKPAGLPVQGDKTRDPDLLTLLKNRIFEREGALEEPYLTAVHRLDRPVGGLMVLARSKEAAAALSQQMKQGLFEKNYQAVCCGRLEEDFGTMEDYLLKNGKTNMTSVVKKDTKGAQYACLDYELIDCIETRKGALTWVLVSLITGRHHQIRVQFASRGLPLYGDTRYNPEFWEAKKTYHQIGLYATRLSFLHPQSGERLTFKTEPQGKAFELMDVEAF